MKYFLFLTLLTSLSVFGSDCAQDAKKYCASVDPGKGQLARCLSDYQDSLSPKCAAELKAFKQNTGKKNPCFEELADFCSDLPSEQVNYEYCLLKNEGRLGPKCAADFRNKKGRIITHNVCAQDVVNTCYAKLTEPEGAVTRCLIHNKTKLSGFCQKNIDKRIADLRSRNHCYDDTEKFCPTQLKFIEIQDCLSKKVNSLTPACKKLVVLEQDKMKANPCYRDLITHCRYGISPQEQNECLTLNEEHLSNSCKQFRVVEKNKIEQMVKLCEQDRLKLCKDAPMKDGAVVRCLRQNKAQVSPGCQKFL